MNNWPKFVPGNPGNIYIATSESHNAASNSKSEVEESQQQSETKQKEKPFGANKNIHTLGCFSNESSRPIKRFGAEGQIANGIRR